MAEELASDQRSARGAGEIKTRRVKRATQQCVALFYWQLHVTNALIDVQYDASQVRLGARRRVQTQSTRHHTDARQTAPVAFGQCGY
jgi:hypothetical protein